MQRLATASGMPSPAGGKTLLYRSVRFRRILLIRHRPLSCGGFKSEVPENYCTGFSLWRGQHFGEEDRSRNNNDSAATDYRNAR